MFHLPNQLTYLDETGCLDYKLSENLIYGHTGLIHYPINIVSLHKIY
jgi:hypothetical protein